MINYSLQSMYTVPGNTDSVKRIFPRAQYNTILDIKDFSRHIANHGSCYSRGTIQAVLTEAVDCLREQLLLGNRIQLGDLGTFAVTLYSKGAESAEAFSTKSITRVRPIWSPGTEFNDLINEASFQYVGSRMSQALARKASKAAIDEELGNTDNNQDDGNLDD